MTTDSSSFPPATQPTADDWLVGGGEMGQLIRSIDWSHTSLGPIAHWPLSLRTTLRMLLSSRHPMFLWWGPDLLQFYNDGYRTTLSTARHPQALGQRGQECWPEIWHIIGPQIDQVMTQGVSTWHEDQLVPTDRHGYLQEVYWTYGYSPIWNEAGSIAGVLVVCTDTTERVLSERRLRTLRDLGTHATEATTTERACRVAAAVLAQHSADLPFTLLYLLSPDHTHADLSARSGLEANLPVSPLQMNLQTDSPDLPWPIAAVLQTRQPLTVTQLSDHIGLLPGGPWPEATHTVLILPLVLPGQTELAGIFIAGVSPRLPLDPAYRSFLELVAGQLGAAIANARAYEAERQRAEALAAIDRAKTAFFSNISHEFRTPLTLLLAPLEDELAERVDALPLARRERLAIAYRNSQRLLKLVNSLLDFARIEAGRMQAIYQPTDLAGLTVDLAGSFRSACERAGLHLNVDCPPLLEPVYVDPDLWEKIVLNLLSNAFKFTLSGEIAVSLHSLGQAVKLVVRDTGCGIPLDELAYIFDRFHRVTGTRGRTHEGSGIGLALVRELVSLHGGTIGVESTLAQGSTFTVSLPFGTAHLPADRIGVAPSLSSTTLGVSPFVEEALRWLVTSALPPAAAEAEDRQRSVLPALIAPAPPLPAQTHATTQRPRIVWADDNADMRTYVLRLLSDNYDVEAVADGEAALAAVRRLAPDLVLSDVMMPGLDGFGLLQELRADERTSTIPIILISARAGEEAQIEGLAAGADDYLIKPFSARALLARVGAHVELARLRREAEVARHAVEMTEVLRASEAQLRLITDALPALISYVASDKSYRFNNRAYEEWFGHARAEVYGKQLADVLGTAAYQTIAEHVEAALAGHPVRYEGSVPYKDGGMRFIQADYIPDTRPDGHTKGFYALVTDITDRKRTEEAQLRTQKLEVLGRLVGGIAHDFNNILLAIMGNTELAIADLPAEHPVQESLNEIVQASARASALVRRILTFSRRQEPKMEVVHLRPVVEEVFKLLRATLPAMIELRAEFAPDVPAVAADTTQIHQIIMNLATNAAHAIGTRGGRIELRLEALNVRGEDADRLPQLHQGHYVHLSVSDNGCGMDQATLEHIFEPFFTTKPGEQGTGLGLAIVESIMTNHRGAVTVSSQVGQGTTFQLYFPAATGRAKRSPARRQDSLYGRGEHVLYVDDEEALVELVTRTFRRWGYQVSGYTDPAQALKQVRLRPQDFDVIVTDLSMPGMSGFDLARALLAVRPNLPILLTTGYIEPEDQATALQLGVHALILKPNTIEELGCALNKLFGSRTDAPEIVNDDVR